MRDQCGPAGGHRRLPCSPHTSPCGRWRNSCWEQTLLPWHKTCRRVHEEAELGATAWLSGLDHSARLKNPIVLFDFLGLCYYISEQGVRTKLRISGPQTAAFQEMFYENILEVPHGNVLLVLTEQPFCLSPVTHLNAREHWRNYTQERKTSPLICFITLSQP